MYSEILVQAVDHHLLRQLAHTTQERLNQDSTVVNTLPVFRTRTSEYACTLALGGLSATNDGKCIARFEREL